MLSARAHTTLRLLAILVIALAALVPRGGHEASSTPVAKATAVPAEATRGPTHAAGLGPVVSRSFARR